MKYNPKKYPIFEWIQFLVQLKKICFQICQERTPLQVFYNNFAQVFSLLVSSEFRNNVYKKFGYLPTKKVSLLNFKQILLNLDLKCYSQTSLKIVFVMFEPRFHQIWKICLYRENKILISILLSKYQVFSLFKTFHVLWDKDWFQNVIIPNS